MKHCVDFLICCVGSFYSEKNINHKSKDMNRWAVISTFYLHTALNFQFPSGWIKYQSINQMPLCAPIHHIQKQGFMHRKKKVLSKFRWFAIFLAFKIINDCACFILRCPPGYKQTIWLIGISFVIIFWNPFSQNVLILLPNTIKECSFWF